MISSLQLARLCKVSQGTVDRALHNRPGIAEKTRQRVLRVARENGYQPNPHVTEILKGRSAIVAGLVPSFNSVFFMDLFQIIAQRLNQQGLRLHVCSYDDAAGFLEQLQDFAARKVAGAVMVPPREKLALPATLLRSMPTVELLSSSGHKQVMAVHPDETRTGFDATQQLLSLGHRRIAMVDFDADTPAIAARYEGYRSAMHEAGLDELRLRQPSPDELQRAIAAHGFTALCRQITTMRYPFEDVARHVVAAIRGQAIQEPVHPCQWVQRETVKRLEPTG